MEAVMARLINPLVGEIRGIVDGFYTRKLRGVTRVAACPKRLKKTMDEGSVSRRKKFSVTAQFAKEVRSLEPLEAVWKLNSGKCSSAFHAICKMNYPLSSVSRPSERNLITPGGFDAGFTETEVHTDGIRAVIPVLSSLISSTGEGAVLSLNTLVCYFGAEGINPDRFQLFAFSNENNDYDFSQSKEIKIDFSPIEKDSAERYSSAILYLAVVVKEKEGNLINYSSTYSRTIL
jgi:hypothetical protein